MMGLKGLKVNFGEGGKDEAADVAVDVDVDMAAVFRDSSVVYLFALSGILLTAKMWKSKKKKEKEKPVPPASPASAAESHKRPIRTDYSSYTRLDSRMRVM